MKYIVVIGDGMADYPLPELGGKTPLQCARKPCIDSLARRGLMGLVQTIPEGMDPGSDTANLSIMGYDPRRYLTGRSPFEAAGMGVELQDGDVTFRCNLVTLSPEEPFEQKVMVDYCAGEISSPEARQLMELINRRLGGGAIKFYPGVSYRHLMVWSGGPDGWQLTPPHDIIGRCIGGHLPAGPEAAFLQAMMEESTCILPDHPVNRAREKAGLNPANAIWIWAAGRKPQLPPFYEKYGLKGSVISAVDLLKGIAVHAGLTPLTVEGATGNINTNYIGKARAALDALLRGDDFVYLHIEAPDECSHRYEIENKIKSIELIDGQVVRTLLEGLEKASLEFKMLIMPDHATPLALRTHSTDPVPFLICRSGDPEIHADRSYDESHAARAGLHLAEGCRLMDLFLSAGGDF